MKKNKIENYIKDSNEDQIMELQVDLPKELQGELPAGKITMVEALLKLVASDYKFTDFCREVLRVVMGTIKSEAGSFFEVDHKSNNIFFRTSIGTASDRLEDIIIPMGSGVVGHVAESRRPIVISNVGKYSHHLKSIDKIVGFETKNMIAAPIVVRGRVFGVIELINRVGENSYDQNDIELLTYFSEMAAKAIEIRLMFCWLHRQSKVIARTSSEASEQRFRKAA